MKEYVKIVQIKKLKMKLTFSLDVQNLVGREIDDLFNFTSAKVKFFYQFI